MGFFADVIADSHLRTGFGASVDSMPVTAPPSTPVLAGESGDMTESEGTVSSLAHVTHANVARTRMEDVLEDVGQSAMGEALSESGRLPPMFTATSRGETPYLDGLRPGMLAPTPQPGAESGGTIEAGVRVSNHGPPPHPSVSPSAMRDAVESMEQAATGEALATSQRPRPTANDRGETPSPDTNMLDELEAHPPDSLDATADRAQTASSVAPRTVQSKPEQVPLQTQAGGPLDKAPSRHLEARPEPREDVYGTAPSSAVEPEQLGALSGMPNPPIENSADGYLPPANRRAEKPVQEGDAAPTAAKATHEPIDDAAPTVTPGDHRPDGQTVLATPGDATACAIRPGHVQARPAVAQVGGVASLPETGNPVSVTAPPAERVTSPTHSFTAPRVHIGRMDILVQAPPAPEPAAPSRTSASSFTSRNYLRSL